MISMNDTTKDQFYEDNGYIVSDDVTDYSKVKEKEKIMTEAIAETEKETGMKVVVRSEEKLENGEKIELPVRISYAENKVKLSRLPIWFVTAIGSMSTQEINQFVVKYQDELSINEKLAIDLLYGALAKDKDALQIFWDIQKKMLQRTNVANQINIAVTPKDTSVTRMLDDIASRIKDADVDAAPENLNTPPTP